jgi:hypothetical protein
MYVVKSRHNVGNVFATAVLPEKSIFSLDCLLLSSARMSVCASIGEDCPGLEVSNRTGTALLASLVVSSQKVKSQVPVPPQSEISVGEGYPSPRHLHVSDRTFHVLLVGPALSTPY